MDIKGLTGAETLLRVLATMGVERIFIGKRTPRLDDLAQRHAEPAFGPQSAHASVFSDSIALVV